MGDQARGARRRPIVWAAVITLLVWSAGLLSAAGQAAPAAGQTAPAPAAPALPAGAQMAETVFKNVQVLKGIPVDEFMDAMGMFSASLGYDCASCHSSEISSNREAFAIATPAIQRARQMVLMMNAINRTNFAGQTKVSCFTCHRGQYRPEIVPSLALQYGELVDDPNAMTIFPSRTATPGPVFAKYIAALGGAQRLAAITSVVAKGTSTGFNTGGATVPVEIFARAPDQRTTVLRTVDGAAIKAYDGRSGWAAEEWRPVPLLTLSGGNLEGARLDALQLFPTGLQAAFSQWQVSSGTIADRPVEILQGTNPGQLPVNFYFDESGLLVRMVRWNRTAVGTVPTQVDYEDYRDVAGVKMPFRSIVTWTDGQNTLELNEVRANIAIDPAQFARPAPFQRRR